LDNWEYNIKGVFRRDENTVCVPTSWSGIINYCYTRNLLEFNLE
jgi:hypothetical protein